MQHQQHHGIHVEVGQHAHNASYSSNEDERVLYKTRRLYVRSNTKSTITNQSPNPSSNNPNNQSFSNSSVKDKSILYARVVFTIIFFEIPEIICIINKKQ